MPIYPKYDIALGNKDIEEVIYSEGEPLEGYLYPNYGQNTKNIKPNEIHH